MNKEEIDIKLRLVEALIIIMGIWATIKVVYENSVNLFIIGLFFVVSIIYFSGFSIGLNKYSRKLLPLIAFLIGVFFSAILGIFIGLNIPGDLSFRSIVALLYYGTLTLVITSALNEREKIFEFRAYLKRNSKMFLILGMILIFLMGVFVGNFFK